MQKKFTMIEKTYMHAQKIVFLFNKRTQQGNMISYLVDGHYNKAISVQMMMVTDNLETVLLEAKIMHADIVHNWKKYTLDRNWNLHSKKTCFLG